MKTIGTSLMVVALLMVVAFAGGSSTAPVAVLAQAAAATSVVEFAVAPSEPPDTTVIEMHTIGPVTTVHDATGSDSLNIRIPDGWSEVQASDVSGSAAFADWRVGHPEIPADVAAAAASDLSTPGFSLLAFDPASTLDGVTPQLAVTWIDAPVVNVDGWLADLEARLTKDLELASAPAHRAWPNLPRGTVDAYQFVYAYEANGKALVGTELSVRLPDGRAAVLTFSCQESQAEEVGWIASAIFESISTGD